MRFMRFWSLALAAVFVFLAGAASDVRPVEIKEWTVPWPDSRPRDPFAESQSCVWFCGQRGGYLAMLDPTTGEFKQYDLGDFVYTAQHTAAVGPDE